MKILTALVLLPICSLGQILPIELKNMPEHKKVEVFVNGKSFTNYIYPSDDVLKKPVLYPILSPQGNLVTRGWPFDPREGERQDHPHHVGLWLNNGNVNGNDFWNNSNDVDHSKKAYGTIMHTGVKRVKSGKKFGELLVTADWKGSDDQLLLKEETRYIFSATSTARVIERITTLQAEVPVLFADNKEGMFAIRLAKELELPDAKMAYKATGNYFNDTGISGSDVWSKRSGWMNLTGTLENEKVSVAMFDHPENHNYPANWHARGYGLYAVNNIGAVVFTKGKETSDLELLKGEKVTFKYRLVIASKHLSEDEMIRYAEQFAKR
ncbi:MAG: hypothetical protein ACJARG_001917 [Arcticibacterium sp.]|jgi:hypothetical protein